MFASLLDRDTNVRAAELTDNLDEADEAELKALLELIEAEERERLAPALAQIREEQAALRQQVQESKVEIDHFLPRSQGSQDTLDNLVYACRACNSF